MLLKAGAGSNSVLAIADRRRPASHTTFGFESDRKTRRNTCTDLQLSELMARSDHRPAGDPLGDVEAESLAQAMAAFSTASRLKLLYALVGIEQTVDGLASATSLSATVVSQQLRLLRLLGLVTGRRDGHFVRYRLYDDHVADLLAAVRNHGEHTPRVGAKAGASSSRVG